MSTDAHNVNGVQFTDALPPVPLTDDQLVPLLDQEAIEAVYVPDGRPEAVYTLAGGHGGDILEFYVETATKYVKFRYTMGPDGLRLAWQRFGPWPKDDPHIEVLEMDLKDYRELEVSE